MVHRGGGERYPASLRGICHHATINKHGNDATAAATTPNNIVVVFAQLKYRWMVGANPDNITKLL